MATVPVSEFRRILRHFERELGRQNQSGCCCGVTIPQCHTLMELSSNDNVTMNELARRLHLDKSTVSRTVESLVQSGLVSREIPELNRRTTRIRLSVQGRSVCKSIDNGNNLYFTKALKAIPPSKLGDFLRAFEQLTNQMTHLNKG
jgi:DNA-binding MarR family transcriptional regulator